MIVRRVTRGGPADRAGLEGLQVDRRNNVRLGDVIVAVGGKKVRDHRRPLPGVRGHRHRQIARRSPSSAKASSRTVAVELIDIAD